MNKVVSFLLTLLLIALIAVSCSKDETTAPDENNVIVPNTTEVVETENANTDISLVTGDSLYVDPESDLADLEVGDIILTDVNNYAPEGILKRITAKNYIGNSIQFETEQASLAEAVEQLSLSETFHLTPSRVRSVEVFNRSQYKSSRDDNEFMIDIDCPLYDQDGNLNTTNDQIALSGDLSFTADIFTVIDISLFSLQQFEIGLESNREANLNLNANLQWEFDDELTFELAQFNFTPITFFAGPVPIVITPELVVEAHVHGDLTVTFTTGISYSEDVRYGVGYEDEAWYQIKESSKTFSYTPPQFSAEFNFETGASLRFNTSLYGVGGPYVRAKAGFQFQSVLYVNPSNTHLDFSLDAMLSAICGIYLEALDQTLLDEYLEFTIYTHDIGEWEIPLAANNPPNSPSNPNPANNTTSVSTNTDLSWSCTDPDGDPLTFDVYFGISSNPSLVSTGQSDTFYDPGTLSEETTYYWKIIAHDDHSHTTDGSVWQFTTQNGGGSNQPPNSPSNPNPTNNATSVSINTDLSWSCTDPDGDPLTYDVYFGISSNPSLVNSGQSNTSYDPGALEEETTYYWKIIAHDDHSHTTDGSVWQFTTQNGGGGGDFEWCTIPAGDYTYGDPPLTQNISYNFQIMKYEVTNQQYVDYLEEALNAGDITVSPSTVEGYYEGDDNYSAGNYEFLDLDGVCRIDWNGSNFSIISGYEDHPVVEVTWFGSWAFAEHYGFSLPTEQEWEKAARGNTGYDYPWGNSIDGSRANYYNSGDLWDNGTTPVGMYNGQTIQGFSTTNSPSPYGAYDMAGNVWNWTDSWWNNTSSDRVERGGSWDNSADYLRSWLRGGVTPAASCSNIGFRCVVP